jgi:hypothetical protein
MKTLLSPTHIIFSEKLAIFPGILFGMSLRKGGVSREPFGMNVSYRVGDEEDAVSRNREIFLDNLGIPATQLATPGQSHSANVLRVDAPGMYADCDGLITSRCGIFLAITVADCVPIFLYDPHQRVVGALHAGWRGTADSIAANGVAIMKSECGSRPSDLVAFVGPSARVCCYEVGEEVAQRFDGFAVRRRNGKIFLDLAAANKKQLLESGMKAENIEVSPFCTISNADLFHSYRRDGNQSGRMMGVIGMV